MTSAATGSVQGGGNPGTPGSPNAAGNPTGANGASGGGSSGGAADILAVLSEDNRRLAETKGWRTADKLNEVFSGYRGLETKLGSEPRLPPATADQTELDKAFRHLGWPEKADGFDLKMPTGLPDNLPYDQAFAGEFRTWAHEARLSPKQAQALHDSYVKRFANDMTVRQGEVSKNVNSAKEWMIKNWGNEQSEPYRQSAEAARRAVVALESKPEFTGLRKELVASGLIIAGEGDHFTPANAALMELLSHYGRTKGMEHQFVGGGGAPGTPGNPFAEGSENYTQQAQLVRKDPVEARRLIVAAGKNPADWKL